MMSKDPDMFFKAVEKTVPIECDGKVFTYKIKGLGWGEQSDIYSQAMKVEEFGRKIDWNLKKIGALVVKYGTVEPEMSLEEVMNLKSKILYTLWQEINTLSDFTTDFKKNLNMPLMESPQIPQPTE